jgi:hypothetical protein
VPKRVCANRAEWRLVRGQRAQHLSAHYRLECDYGTAFLTIYNEGDAVYLCESHAATVRNSEAPTIAGVRLIETPTTGGREPVTSDGQVPASLAKTASPSAAVPAAASREAVESRGLETLEAAIQSLQLEIVESSQPAEPEIVAANPSCSVSATAETQAIASHRPETQAIEIREAETSNAASQVPLTEAGKPSDPAVREPDSEVPLASTRRETVRPAAKAFTRDLTYGDCAKALVDEAIWNLEPGDYEAYKSALFGGKSAGDAAQAAGGQLAIVLRRIGEYASKLEGLLSGSKATIDVSEAIDKPLEQAMLDIIGDSAMSDAEKDSAVDHLEALQKEIDGGLGRAISALQAHRITIAIAERANWGARSDLAEELKPAYRAVYSSVRNALVSAVPEARALDERLANLYAAKSDIASTPTVKAQHSVAR